MRKRHTGQKPVLDAYAVSWACVTSDQGVPYFLLWYACTLFDEVGRCRGPAKEWERLVEADGSVLPTRRSSAEAAYLRLGLSKLLDDKGLQLQGIKVH